MTKVITYGSVVEALDSLLSEFSNNEPLSVSHAEVVSFAVNHDVQIRDYLLGGLPETLTANGAIHFVTDLLPLVAETDRVPFYTILTAFYHEAGDNELAYASLFTAQNLNADYPLAKLFERGLERINFAEMRSELHPKVLELINENRELVIL